ncbi:unnamed protein product [Phytophthora fragariaefolia]|uniref:Unnamed protein product n=1 Tax=Phytophthora fragariaefolia TaxID=1490495 RepID=A0A9W6XD68_9STRA|nr:unnamed protein product [Phytophthora fragariaefolia]
MNGGHSAMWPTRMYPLVHVALTWRLTECLEALFDVGITADIEDGDEDEEISSSRPDDPSVGSRRPRQDDSDASSSKRSRSCSDRPLADAGPLPSPRRGARSNLAPSQYALYSWSGIIDDDVIKELDVESTTDQIRDYYIGSMSSDVTGIRRLPVEAECPNERHSVKAGVRLLKTSTRTQLVTVAVEAGIPCAVPMGVAGEHCHVGAVRVSERDINGYIGVRVPEELKPLRTNLVAQMSSSAAGGRSTLPRAVGDYSSRLSFTPFGGFGGDGLRTSPPSPERSASGRSAAPTYRGSEEILSNEYENDLDLGSRSDWTIQRAAPCASRSGGGGCGKTPRVWSARLR